MAGKRSPETRELLRRPVNDVAEVIGGRTGTALWRAARWWCCEVSEGGHGSSKPMLMADLCSCYEVMLQCRRWGLIGLKPKQLSLVRDFLALHGLSFKPDPLTKEVRRTPAMVHADCLEGRGFKEAADELRKFDG